MEFKDVLLKTSIENNGPKSRKLGTPYVCFRNDRGYITHYIWMDFRVTKKIK